MKIIMVFFCIGILSCSVAQEFNHVGLTNDPLVKQVNLPTGVTLEYTEQGDKTEIPVILLHGFTDSRHSYDQVLKQLPANTHAIAISQRGHGNSSKPSKGYAIEDFVNDLAAFMDQLNIEKAYLVGHSMSSVIVQLFSIQHPERTAGIVLEGAFANYDNPVLMEFREYVTHLTDPLDTAFVYSFQEGTLAMPIPTDQLQLFVNESLKVPAQIWKNIAANWSDIDYTPGLRMANIPALIIWGAKDGFCPKEDQEILKNALSGCRLITYQNAGHAIHWEMPEKFSLDLVHFVNAQKNQMER